MRDAGKTEGISAPDSGDRYLGCLMGLAAGDALGAPVEFEPRGTFRPLDGFRAGGPFNLAAGTWTDDTSMALCLAESLLERGGFDPADQMRRYVAWRSRGHLSATGHCFDIGGTTLGALTAFSETGEPFSGPTDPQTAGNGSLMRLAPVPMRFLADPERAIALAGASSRTTHGAAEAVDACRYFAGLLVGALRGEVKESLLSPLYCPVQGLWERQPLAAGVARVAAGSFRSKGRDAVRASGYVLHTLEAALWAFHGTGSFAEGALLAVNLGEDADTTGAVYGQLAGAFYGLSGIPAAWRKGLVQADLVLGFAERLWLAAEECG